MDQSISQVQGDNGDTGQYRVAQQPYYRPMRDEIDVFSAAYQVRMPVMLKGPTGCGKSRFIEHMAWVLNRPLITVACTEDMTASDLVGRHLLDINGTRWQDGPLTVAARIGAICYLDEVVEALEVLDLRTGQCAWWTAKDCAFSYRNSRFRQSLGAYLVLTLRLRLHRGGRPVLGYAGVEAGLAQRLAPGAKARPSDLVEAVRALRADKLPDWRRLPNVGSFFKNPQLSPEALQRLRARAPELALRPFASSGGKVSAAALIQGAGWRGRRRGPVGMAQQHALVLVNYGGATRDDVDWLAGSVQASVYASFGVRLEREPLHL